MEAVWQLEVIWHARGIADLGEWPRNMYVAIVRDYGGTLTPQGHATFRRYRPAEICARLVEWQLGLVPTIALKASR
jgi:hypothetical protein